LRLARLLLPALGLGLGMACTVDELVGSSSITDGGTPICRGEGPGPCDAVCGAQHCRTSCTGVADCDVHCDGGDCVLSCEAQAQSCSSTCDPGPCQGGPCVQAGEDMRCPVSCNPEQACAFDCHGGSCTLVCGDVRQAAVCDADAGVYSCSGSCPP